MKFQIILSALALSAAALSHSALAHGDASDGIPPKVIEVQAADSNERSKLANLGYALEEFRTGKVYVYGDDKDLKKIQKAGFTANAYDMKPEWLEFEDGGSMTVMQDGTPTTLAYHSYDEVTQILTDLATQNSKFVSLVSLGKSLEKRDVPMLRISGKSLQQAEEQKLPVAFYMGCHHAREHLSVEVPLMWAQYLIANYGKDPDVTRLVDSREIYVAPMVNPDGHVYDRTGNGKGRMWRKNRAHNEGGTYGVDLNRNYGYQWGTGGSSTDGDSDVYMGPHPFSEPETQNVRDFVLSQPRMTVLLTLHTFSELVLYPWGHSHDQIGETRGKAADLPVFEKMANQFASWNHYTPEQSSSLYIASGDTTDWAYGERGIFAFTFELTPTSLFNGGFYPSPSVIQPTFDANVKPMMYMLEYADHPARVLTEKAPSFLTTPAKRGVAAASFNDVNL